MRDAREHRCDVIFAGGIKAARPRRVGIAHQPVGADHHRLAVVVEDGAIDNQHVIAKFVEPVEIAPSVAHRGTGDR